MSCWLHPYSRALLLTLSYYCLPRLGVPMLWTGANVASMQPQSMACGSSSLAVKALNSQDSPEVCSVYNRSIFLLHHFSGHLASNSPRKANPLRPLGLPSTRTQDSCSSLAAITPGHSTIGYTIQLIIVTMSVTESAPELETSYTETSMDSSRDAPRIRPLPSWGEKHLVDVGPS
jgi:hypothetical protein